MNPATRECPVDHAQRLDAFVRAVLPAVSRQVVQAMIADGTVRVNGRAAAKGRALSPGDVVTVPADVSLVPRPDLPVVPRHLDAALVVVDKPGGLPSHAIDPRRGACVAAWLAANFPETAAVGEPLAAGLVHRLDTGTSGLLIAARTIAAYERLRAAFRDRAVRKIYRALVAGRMERAHHIDRPLAHDRADRRRMVVADGRGRSWPAQTDVAPRMLDRECTLVEIEMHTGVTHQIRVHLAAVGHPILGDVLYGGPPLALPSPRHALHAARLTFPHPTTAAPITVDAPWPDDLARICPGDAR